MASPRAGFFSFLLVAATLLLSCPVICDNDKEKTLFQGLNNYRKTQGLPALTRNDKADCLADKIADKLEKQPCTGANAPPSALPQLKDYPKQLSKCNIDEKTTTNGTILPVCVHKLDPTTVLSNYTRTNHAKFLNDSKYSIAGVGSEDDWMVVVLFANAPGASASANAAPSVSEGSIGHAFFLVLGFVHFVMHLLN